MKEHAISLIINDIDNHSRENTLSDLQSKPTLGLELPERGIDLKNLLLETEKSLIYQALSRSRGVVANAAKLLKIQRTTLVEKMRKYNIKREELVTE